ncbi:hypothetical protein CspHIS471_0102250 [Cutaneotrichosporon sp. HIS471]|nr:hypothetical protein CspHIS471_0102250 [Cutaneotrichosporon sp. HIS471]
MSEELASILRELASVKRACAELERLRIENEGDLEALRDSFQVALHVIAELQIKDASSERGGAPEFETQTDKEIENEVREIQAEMARICA